MKAAKEWCCCGRWVCDFCTPPREKDFIESLAVARVLGEHMGEEQRKEARKELDAMCQLRREKYGQW
jgi:hypothetical protein